MSAAFLMCAAKNGWLAERWAAFLQITFWYVRTYVYSYKKYLSCSRKALSILPDCVQTADRCAEVISGSIGIHTYKARCTSTYLLTRYF